MITDRPIRLDSDEVARAEAAHGAVVTFAGVVRDHNDGRPVAGVYYECYREMAERELSRLAAETEVRFPVKVARLEHRVGELAVGDVSLLLIVGSSHRKNAFGACQHIIDEMKQRVPIWKKERYADESAKWL